MRLVPCDFKKDAAAGMVVRENRQLHKIQILCNASTDLDGDLQQMTLDMELGLTGWHLWLPMLRTGVQQIGIRRASP